MYGDYGNKKNPVPPFEFSEDEDLLKYKAEEPLAQAAQGPTKSSLSKSKNRVYAPPPPMAIKEECKTMLPPSSTGRGLLSPLIVSRMLKLNREQEKSR